MKHIHTIRYRILALFLACILPQLLLAVPNTRPLVFTENAGQITDQYGRPRPDVLYRVDQPGMSIFICRDGLHYQFCAPDGKEARDGNDAQECSYTLRRVDATLVGANTNASVMPGGRQQYKEIYYTNNLSGATAYSFTSITIGDIYPGIDWKIYAKSGELEYDFIVHAGADPGRIRIRYAGADSVVQTARGIRLSTALGYVTEKNIHVFDALGKTIPANALLKNGELSFAVQAGAATGAYTIDPVLEWATYFGGNAGENGWALATDQKGNVVMGGTTSSWSNIAIGGAYQSSLQGFQDGYIAKFAANGELMWSTYFGGSSFDYIRAIAIDSHNNIIAAGRTQSNAGLATTGAAQTVLSGSIDGFLAKFDEYGYIAWATYVGGNNFDMVHSLAIDTADNIYAAGITSSTTGLATTGASQSSSGGMYDGFVAAYTAAGSKQWCTYFGGESFDSVLSISYLAGKLYATGATQSTTGIATSGAPQGSLNGLKNGFVAIFGIDGTLVKSTYWGSDYNMPMAIGATAAGIFIAGITTSDVGIATAGSYHSARGGDKDGFLARLDMSLNTVWSTYYGASGYDQLMALAVDAKGNIVTCGSTSSSDSIIVGNGLQPGLQGGTNACIAIFDVDGRCHWSSYFGGTGNANGVSIDAAGNIFISGFTTSTDSIATPGAYQTVYGGSSDAFLAKLSSTDFTGTSTPLSATHYIRLSPNPAHDKLHIQCAFNMDHAVVRTSITDMAGREITAATSPISNKTFEHDADVTGLSAGMYLYRIETDGESYTVPFIRQ